MKPVLPMMRELEVEALDEGFREGGVGEFFRRGVVDAVAFFQAGDAEVAQVAGAVGFDFGGKRVFRVTLAAFGKRDREVAHLGDELGVRDGLGHLGEELRHLVARLQVKLLAVEAHALLVVDLRAGLDAEHGVVRAGVGVADVVNVVGADDLEVELLGELEEAGDDFALLGDAVVLDLDEIIFAAEDFDEAAAGLARLLVAVVEQVLRHERGEAAGEADQAVGVLRERLEVGARLVIKTLEVRVGDELEEVLVAGEVFREQAEVKDGFAVVVGAAVFFEAGGFDEVEFAADERLDALGLGLVVELDRAVEIAVVGEGEGAHAELGGAIHQPVDAAAAIEQAVVGVDVEMDEILVGGRHGLVKQAQRGMRKAEMRETEKPGKLIEDSSKPDAAACEFMVFLLTLGRWQKSH